LAHSFSSAWQRWHGRTGQCTSWNPGRGAGGRGGTDGQGVEGEKKRGVGGEKREKRGECE
jgi:hypothetical protein